MRITIDRHAVGARVMDAWKAGLKDLSEEILADCNEYCKENQHTLIDSSLAHSKPEEGRLIWDTPYARRQYWEIERSLTPGRTWKWCETAKMRHKTRWKELAQRKLREHL